RGSRGGVAFVHVADRDHVLLDRVHVGCALPADADAADAYRFGGFLLGQERGPVRCCGEHEEATAGGSAFQERAAGEVRHSRPPGKRVWDMFVVARTPEEGNTAIVHQSTSGTASSSIQSPPRSPQWRRLNAS